MIVVQEIRVIWSKASRGAPGATRRNAVPETAPLSLEGHEPLAYNRQLLSYGEPDVEPAIEVVTRPELPHGDRHLTFDPAKGETPCQWIEFARAGIETVNPPRPALELALEEDSWIRIRFNSRILHHHQGEFSQWLWHKTVLNVGCFSAWPGEAVFLGEPPRQKDLTVQHLPRDRVEVERDADGTLREGGSS